MGKVILFVLATLFCNSSFAQHFEGKIIYKNAYKSKVPNATDEQITAMMGSTQEYYIKNGDYKSLLNGTYIQWQLYLNKENKLYIKSVNSEVLTQTDGSIATDEVLKSEINKEVIEILGYKCDELILTCRNSIQKYYFNSKLSVDAKLFSNHKFGSWHDFLSRSNALPLKYTIETPQFSMESLATEITEMKLDTTMFELPTNAQIKSL